MSQVLIATEIPAPALQKLRDQGIEYAEYLGRGAADEKYLLEHISDASAIVSAVNVSVSKKVIDRATGLKVIANIGDGFSNIDIDAATARNIPVTNTPTHDSIFSTAELTFSLLLALSRRVINGHKMCEKQAFEGWQVTGYLGGHQVSGKKLAIVGLGRIGKVVARMARGFDMPVVYVDPVDAGKEMEKGLNVERVDLREALSIADYLTLNCSYSQENHHMIDEEQFAQMGKQAYLINCARGLLINEAALVKALTSGAIAGAALDVHEFEPHITDGLRKLHNVVLTPHIGNDTVEARNEMAATAVEQVINALAGKPLSHVVNKH